MSSPATDVLGARAKPLPEYVWFPSQQGKPFLNAKNDDMQKKMGSRRGRAWAVRCACEAGTGRFSQGQSFIT